MKQTYLAVFDIRLVSMRELRDLMLERLRKITKSFSISEIPSGIVDEIKREVKFQIQLETTKYIEKERVLKTIAGLPLIKFNEIFPTQPTTRKWKIEILDQSSKYIKCESLINALRGALLFLRPKILNIKSEGAFGRYDEIRKLTLEIDDKFKRKGLSGLIARALMSYFGGKIKLRDLRSVER